MHFTAQSVNSGYVAMASELDLCDIGKVLMEERIDLLAGLEASQIARDRWRVACRLKQIGVARSPLDPRGKVRGDSDKLRLAARFRRFDHRAQRLDGQILERNGRRG